MGIYVWDGMQQQYCRLIRAGTSWYDAAVSCEFLPDNCDSIVLQTDSIMEPYEEKKSERITIGLGWLPKRPNLATKIRLDIGFESEKKWNVTVTDLGLGELFQSSKKSVTKQIEV